MMMRLSFKDMRGFRDPRTGEPLREGSIFNVICRGAEKALAIKRGNAVTICDEATGRMLQARVLSVRLTYIQKLGVEELSMLPMPNTGTPRQYVKRLQARYGDCLGSILTLVKVELVS